MLPELGTFSIVLALCFAMLQGLSALFCRSCEADIATPCLSRDPADRKRFLFSGLRDKNGVTVAAVIGQFIFLCFAMLCLILSFINNDLTVIYVREHSHALLPLLYRIGAAWGGHEGSLLLWCVILSGWTGAFTFLA